MPQSPLSSVKTARLLSAAATVNATVVKAAAGTLKRIAGYNARASAVYLKLYDMTSTPASTDTPRKTIYLPASAAFDLEQDAYFGTGIAYRMTTAGADNDTGALTAGDILAFSADYI
jgi:hypothetical protein